MLHAERDAHKNSYTSDEKTGAESLNLAHGCIARRQQD